MLILVVIIFEDPAHPDHLVEFCYEIEALSMLNDLLKCFSTRRHCQQTIIIECLNTWDLSKNKRLHNKLI